MGNGFSMLVLLEWDRLVLQMGGEQVVDKNLRRGRSCLNRVKSKKQKRELIYWGGGVLSSCNRNSIRQTNWGWWVRVRSIKVY